MKKTNLDGTILEEVTHHHELKLNLKGADYVEVQVIDEVHCDVVVGFGDKHFVFGALDHTFAREISHRWLSAQRT